MGRTDFLAFLLCSCLPQLVCHTGLRLLQPGKGWEKTQNGKKRVTVFGCAHVEEGFQTSYLKKKKKSQITTLADTNKEWNEILVSISPQHCSSILGNHPVKRLISNSFSECPSVLRLHSQQTWASQICPTKHLAALLLQIQLLKS